MGEGAEVESTGRRFLPILTLRAVCKRCGCLRREWERGGFLSGEGSVAWPQEHQ